jgi:shikimate dehydrogenase
MQKAGLIGAKLVHSLSPEIHDAFYRRTDTDGSYGLLETEPNGLAALLSRVESEGYVGVNVTIPYKKAVIPLLDALSDAAAAIGAVNTVHFSNGRRFGHNTDYYGLKTLLDTNGMTISGRRVVILGTGGAARCAHYLMRDMGAGEIITVSRRPQNADAVFDAMSYDVLRDLDAIDVLINTTPVGTYPHVNACPVTPDIIKKSAAVVDLIYNPTQTQLLQYAAQFGKRGANGLLMLSAQAVKAQEIWTGKTYGNAVYADVHAAVQGLSAPHKTNIILIGMPGSGKTTIGQHLAKALGRRFVDTDDLIEQAHGPIPDIFRDAGEAMFRQYEYDAALTAAGLTDAVIATGGGIILHERNMQALSRTGIIVFLDRPLEKLMADTDTSYRPLLADGKTALAALYETRFPLYHKYADITPDNSGDITTCVEDIIKQTKEIIL